METEGEAKTLASNIELQYICVYHIWSSSRLIGKPMYGEM